MEEVDCLLTKKMKVARNDFVPVYLFKWLQETPFIASDRYLNQTVNAFRFVESYDYKGDDFMSGYDKMTALALCTSSLNKLISSTSGKLQTSA